MNGCLSLCNSPVTDWWPLYGVPRLSAYDNWDRASNVQFCQIKCAPLPAVATEQLKVAFFLLCNTRKLSFDTPVHSLQWKLCVRPRHRLTQREILLLLYQRTSVIKGGGEAHTLIISPWVIYRQIRMWTCRTALYAWATLNKSVGVITLILIWLTCN